MTRFPQRFLAGSSASLLAALACSPALAQSAPASSPAQPVQPAAAKPAPGEETAPVPVFDPNKSWAVRIEPRVWYVAPEGDLKLPGSAPNVRSVELDTLNADDPEASFEGEVMIRVPHDDDATWRSDTFWKKGWFFRVGGASFSGDADSTAPAGGFTIGSLTVAAGDDVSTDVEWSTFHALVGKWVAGTNFDTGGDVHVDLYAVAGVRVHSQDISVTSGGTTVGGSETFFAAVFGARLDIQLPGDFAVDIDVNANFWPGDQSCAGFEISPTFTWRPTANLGVQVGYRLITANCESGDENGSNFYKLNGSLAGVYAGIEIRF